MADVFDSKKRSDIMSKARSNNNKSTELALIKFFKENHITGWKRNYPIKGHPDFVFLDKKLQYSLIVAFGTVTIVETLVLQIMRHIGIKSENAK